MHREFRNCSESLLEMFSVLSWHSLLLSTKSHVSFFTFQSLREQNLGHVRLVFAL